MSADDLPFVFWTSLLHDVADILASTESAERRLDRVLTLMRRVLPCDRAALWEVSPVLARPITILPEVSNEERVALAGRLAGLVRLLSDVSPHREPGAASAAKAHLAVPLIGIGEIIGILYVERFEGSFDEGHLALLSGVAAQISAYLTVLRAQLALRESEKKFRHIYEAGMIGIAFLDAAGMVTGANEQAQRILGTMPAAPAVQGQGARGASGHRGEEALRLSEARFAGIIAAAADAIISVDQEQRIVLYNQGAQKVFGYTRDEVLGKPLDMLLPARFREPHRAHVRSFARAPVEARLMRELGPTIIGLRKNGEEFPAEAAISKLTSGDTSFFTAILRDITERKRVEDEQRFLAEVGAILASTLDQEEILTRIATLAVRGLADCCIVDFMDDEARMRRLEVAVADPAQTELAEVLRRTPLDEQRPYFARSAIDTRQPLLMRDVPAEYVELLGHSAESLAALRALNPRSFMAAPLLAHGQCLGAIVFISTRPARRYGPQDLRLAEELTRRAALAVDNTRLYRAAQQAIRARDEVLGIVAHDLRNPMSTIRLAAEVLRSQLAQDGGQTRYGAIDMILRASKRADRLLQDLVAVNRLEAGQLSLERTELSATRLALDVVDDQRALAAAASLVLRADPCQESPVIWADGERLLQVLENLIGNAVKFTAPGGQITVGAAPVAGEVLFRVADTGCGIAPEHLPHVFDRFWQAHRTERGGAGLGLAICKGIVEAHGGRLWVESTPGAGSTFFFTIPAPPPRQHD